VRTGEVYLDRFYLSEREWLLPCNKKKRNNGFIISNSHLVESGYFTKPRVISPAAVIAQVHC